MTLFLRVLPLSSSLHTVYQFGRFDQLLHTTLRYHIDMRSFLHGEKGGTYTDYEPFNVLIPQF